MLIPGRGLLLIIVASAMLGGFIEHAVRGRDKIAETVLKRDTNSNDIVTVVKEVVGRNGESTKETITTDKSVRASELHSELSLSISEPAPNWMLYGTIDMNRVYGLGIQRRVLGNIFIGAYADSERRLGVSLGVLF